MAREGETDRVLVRISPPVQSGKGVTPGFGITMISKRHTIRATIRVRTAAQNFTPHRTPTRRITGTRCSHVCATTSRSSATLSSGTSPDSASTYRSRSAIDSPAAARA